MLLKKIYDHSSILPFVLVLLGCQTTNYINKEELNSDDLSLFSACYPADGGGYIQILQDNNPIISSRWDWIASSEKTIKAELSDILGRSILTFSVSEEGVFVDGRTSLKQRIALDSEKFITVNEQRTGVRLDELSCFLNYKYPLNWMEHISEIRSKEFARYIKIIDHGREITIKSDPKNNSYCANISWSNYIFWQTNFTLCYRDVKLKRKINLTLPNAIKVILEEEHYEQ